MLWAKAGCFYADIVFAGISRAAAVTYGFRKHKLNKESSSPSSHFCRTSPFQFKCPHPSKTVAPIY